MDNVWNRVNTKTATSMVSGSSVAYSSTKVILQYGETSQARTIELWRLCTTCSHILSRSHEQWQSVTEEAKHCSRYRTSFQYGVNVNFLLLSPQIWDVKLES